MYAMGSVNKAQAAQPCPILPAQYPTTNAQPRGTQRRASTLAVDGITVSVFSSHHHHHHGGDGSRPSVASISEKYIWNHNHNETPHLESQLQPRLSLAKPETRTKTS